MTGTSILQVEGPYVVIARLRMSLVPTRRWQPLQVVLERFRMVGVKGNGLIQPSLAMNSRGRGIVAVSLAGPSYYPSAAYATVNGETAAGDVVVAGAGGAALDDYSGYMGFSEAVRYGDYMTAEVDEAENARLSVLLPSISPLLLPPPFQAVRYGDYMTAGIDEQGNAWGAVQYVPGRPRTHWTNWATYIFKVTL
ncbi:unnamed protein product [Closterium sp. NIES-65]|nr:unnamed protein product [Closterium sp. NIES-65]CAI6003074.1 unnamed protein product [Closterium sp. NIES-65]